MIDPETPEAINDGAAAWVARLDRSGQDPAVARDLATWLGDDQRRHGAFFRAHVAWTMLDRARVLHADSLPLTTNKRIGRRTLLFGSASAAAAALVGAVGASFWLSDRPRTNEFRTGLGDIRQVALADGSRISLNANTVVRAELGRASRHVEMRAGEAWFQVAKDSRRPFVVEVGSLRVSAVGTAFAIRLENGGADVSVTEGVVAVWSVGAPSAKRLVTAGMHTFATESLGAAPPVAAPDELDHRLAWRTGQLIFDGETLGEAAQEFNRYNVVQLVVKDPALASERVVGRFRTERPREFAAAAAEILDAQVEVAPNEIRIVPKNR